MNWFLKILTANIKITFTSILRAITSTLKKVISKIDCYLPEKYISIWADAHGSRITTSRNPDSVLPSILFNFFEWCVNKVNNEFKEMTET